ncbi:MAG TPA: flagellar biosynthesis repressor FlbT [Roseiarcus sp.]|nr:flagellar biosynthesis repressor FlbT [Roseiarcus sp.]
MNISLRADEKLYINGAVIRVDRKVSIELLNDVTFLLEAHVMQANEATTPLRQIYFVIQIMLMDPSATAGAMALSRKLIDSALKAFEAPEILAGLKSVDEMVARSRYFDGMKALRALFPLEHAVMFPDANAPTRNVA